MKKFTAKKEDKLIKLNNFSSQKIHLKNGKGMKLSSANWLRRHINDRFVQMSKEEGYLSRAAYKVIEIVEKFPILKKDTYRILDLGCSPGSWSQALNEIFNYNIKLIGVDLLECQYSNENFTFIQGDFEDSDIQEKILNSSNNKKLDLIVSDIANNAIGDSEADRIVNIRLIESCLDFINLNLKKNGHFVFKSLYGSYQILHPILKDKFLLIKNFKPQSSRKDSTEMYVVCIGKK